MVGRAGRVSSRGSSRWCTGSLGVATVEVLEYTDDGLLRCECTLIVCVMGVGGVASRD